jgi:hypothetical protein
MAVPVIILGAGASHDYIDPSQDRDILHNNQPPLTKELFHARKYDDLLIKYPDVGVLASDLYSRQYLKFEEYLTDIKEKRAAKDAGRQRQLVALEFYLQDLFRSLSEKYGYQPTNNYSALIQRIKDQDELGNGKACVINFNYDYLFEQNIPDINQNISSYISGSIKVIKPHGSCEWRYVLNIFNINIKDSYSYLIDNVWYNTMPENQNLQLYTTRMNLDGSYKKDNVYLYPAVAIPLSNKQYFICPQEHINSMIESFKNTDRILIVGWRAGDTRLLETMKEYLSPNVKITIVSSEPKSALEVKQNLSKFINANFDLSERNTFSQFMKSSESVDFFSPEYAKIPGKR